MDDSESLQSYLSRVSTVVSQMRNLGATIPEEDVVSKVLRSLTKRWNPVVPAIMESKDLSSLTFDSLMGSLLAHEGWLLPYDDKSEEKAFHVKGDSSKGRGNHSGGNRVTIEGAGAEAEVEATVGQPPATNDLLQSPCLARTVCHQPPDHW